MEQSIWSCCNWYTEALGFFLLAVGHKLGHAPATDFNLNDIPNPPNMEVSNIAESSNDGTAMDSDDLVPSLQVSTKHQALISTNP